MRTLKQLRDEETDELSFGGYTIDILQAEGKKNVELAEKKMKKYDNEDREMYNYWCGYRYAFKVFFGV